MKIPKEIKCWLNDLKCSNKSYSPEAILLELFERLENSDVVQEDVKNIEDKLYFVVGEIYENYSETYIESRIVKASSTHEAEKKFVKYFKYKSFEYDIIYSVLSVDANVIIE